eukprot:gene16041-biopygen12715
MWDEGGMGDDKYMWGWGLAPVVVREHLLRKPLRTRLPQRRVSGITECQLHCCEPPRRCCACRSPSMQALVAPPTDDSQKNNQHPVDPVTPKPHPLGCLRRSPNAHGTLPHTAKQTEHCLISPYRAQALQPTMTRACPISQPRTSPLNRQSMSNGVQAEERCAVVVGPTQLFAKNCARGIRKLPPTGFSPPPTPGQMPTATALQSRKAAAVPRGWGGVGWGSKFESCKRRAVADSAFGMAAQQRRRMKAKISLWDDGKKALQQKVIKMATRETHYARKMDTSGCSKSDKQPQGGNDKAATWR